jgi:hypothetical protein
MCVFYYIQLQLPVLLVSRFTLLFPVAFSLSIFNLVKILFSLLTSPYFNVP